MIPVPPAFALFAQLRSLGQLAATLGVPFETLASMPADVVHDLRTVHETIDAYRQHLIQEAERNARNDSGV